MSQLIKQAERRLGNAEACISWYQREKDEALSELDELRNLLTLIDSAEGASTEDNE